MSIRREGPSLFALWYIMEVVKAKASPFVSKPNSKDLALMVWKEIKAGKDGRDP